MDAGALLALKNAWNGAVGTADRLRDLAPNITALTDPAALSEPELKAMLAAARGG